MAPSKEHGCEWQEYAKTLEERIAKLEETIRSRQHKSEKRPKRTSSNLPPAAPPVAEAAGVETELRNATIQTQTVDLKVPEGARRCPACTKSNLRTVGSGKPSTVYEYVSGHFRKRIYRRETLACSCGEYIVTAPAPERVGEKVQYGASFVAHVVTAKCADNRAQYNLAKEYQRVGIPMSRSTLNTLFHRAAVELAPLAARLMSRIGTAEVVLADETSIKVQTATKRAFMWTFLGDGLVGYEFAMDRSGDTPKRVLGDSAGYLVCDAYTGYNKLLALGQRVRGGCLAHARRKIFEADEACAALDWIGAIYAIERRAAVQGVKGTAEHEKLRREARRPFAKLLLWARSALRQHGPKSLFGRASRYIVNNFRELGLFLRTPLVPVDNNRSEAALRRVALGRKNFLFVAHEDAGKNLAGLYSLVASCEAHQKNPVEYLTDVLLRVGRSGEKLDDLLPDRWKPS